MNPPVLFRELQPVPDVIGTFEHLRARPYALLLDSSAFGTATETGSETRPGTISGEFSFAAASPVRVFRATGSSVSILNPQDGTIVQKEGKLLDVARDDLRTRGRWQRAPIAGLPPFQGGLAGYVGYEYGGVLERIPRAVRTPFEAPDAEFADYTWVIAWDHRQQRAWVIGDDQHAIDTVAEELYGAPVTGERSVPARRDGANDTDWHASSRASFHASLSRDDYERAIARIHEYIAAGDIFQANFAQQFSHPFTQSPWELYLQLRAINPAPFAAYLEASKTTIVSASPERFLRVTPDGLVETCPIKGTRPRGGTPEQDAQYRHDLQQSPKDAAEHVMIVDVLRNDLARVCTYGSVTVPRLMALESYATVHHLVSSVTGQLREHQDAIDLIHAAFPGGSITGAPKVRAMEIIAELEPVTRNVYCGMLGYVSVTGAMDSSIAIRTCVVADDTVYFSAGGGIVYDSDPAAEYQESLDKARALMLAVARASEEASGEPACNL